MAGFRNKILCSVMNSGGAGGVIPTVVQAEEGQCLADKICEF